LGKGESSGGVWRVTCGLLHVEVGGGGGGRWEMDRNGVGVRRGGGDAHDGGPRGTIERGRRESPWEENTVRRKMRRG